MFQYHSTSQKDDPLKDHHGILRDNFDFATELEELLQTKHNNKMLEEIRRTNPFTPSAATRFTMDHNLAEE